MELTTENHCAVYEDELKRVWPRKDKARQAKIETFAASNGWRLRFYHVGICAIFDKA